ncbi:MAG: phosphate acyltransferase, partial [Methylocystis sp.]
HKLLLVTDAAININPNLLIKRDIVQNVIDLAHAIGIACPKIALLSAIETIEEKIPSTIQAAALCKMAERSQITGAILDGPLAFDNAISRDAATTKNIKPIVAGEADVLVAPDLEAGNILAKELVFLSGANTAGLVLGARAPIILTSRSDDIVSRVASSALAQLFIHRKRHLF